LSNVIHILPVSNNLECTASAVGEIKNLVRQNGKIKTFLIINESSF